MIVRATLAAAWAVACSLLATSPAAAEPLLLSGAKVVTNTGRPLEVGDVLIDQGRIVAVGPSLSAPAGARRIDAKGKWLTPGLFAAVSRVGLADIGATDSSDIGTTGDDAPTAALDAAPAYNPDAASVKVSRGGGVTRIALAPGGSAGMFSGRGAIVSLGEAASPVLAPRAFLLLDVGERGADLTNGARTALWPKLEAAFDDALGYPERYRSGQGGVVLSELDAQALQPFVRGQGLILVGADRAADLQQVIALKRRRPALQLAVVGATEGWRVASSLAAAKIPVIVNPMQALPDSFEQLGARLDNAALLEAAGVTVAIGFPPGTDDAFQNRLLTQYAGNAVANGLDWNAAFAAISSRPASLFGQSEFGRIAPGAIADLVLWDSDPLEASSAAVQVFIAGRPAALDTRQKALFERYRTIVLPAAP